MHIQSNYKVITKMGTFSCSVVAGYIILLLEIIPCITGSNKLFEKDIGLHRFTRNEGFHVDLVTRVQLGGELREAACGVATSCTLLVNETIPSGVYADLHQLNDPALRLNSQFQVYSSHKFDVEASQDKSLTQSLLIFTNLSSREARSSCHALVTLPLHLRYHPPRPDGGRAVVVLPPPTLHIRCRDGPLSSEQAGLVEAPCSADEPKAVCWWLSLPTSTAPALELEVPVGDTHHSDFVSFATVAVTVCGAFYVIAYVCQRREKPKSE